MNLRIYLTLFIIFLKEDVFINGECQNNLCEWEPWEPWSSCTCEGGTRKRYRSLCCLTSLIESKDKDACKKACGKTSDGYREYGDCPLFPGTYRARGVDCRDGIHETCFLGGEIFS